MEGGPGNDLLDGGNGPDTYEFLGGFGRDRLADAGGRDDNLYFSTESGLVIDLSSGAKPNVSSKEHSGTVDWADSVTIEDASGSYGDDTMVGNDAPNWLPGWEGNNDISGGGGADTIWSDGGGTISGGEGNDDIERGPGEGNIHGGPGDDEISAGLGADVIDCGEGADVANIGLGAPEPLNCETVNRF